MIGAVILVTGLLLVLAGLAAARIPGGATFARPGIAAFSPIRAVILSPIHPTTWYANLAIGQGLFVGSFGFALVAALASAGISVLLAGIGVVLVGAALEGGRIVARVERARVFRGEPARPLPHSYRPLRGGPIDLLRAEFLDESRWRDALYVAINFPLAVLEFVVVVLAWAVALALLTTPIWYDAAPGAALNLALGPLASHDPAIVGLRALLGFALLVLAASISQLVIALHRGLVTNLLCTSESRELRRQVETLRQSRSAVLDVEAGELQRIERDLHDGAQQRLVALSIDLGLASERVETDPDEARRLILEGQAQAREALADIRDLVRGIAPSILLDRGLRAAIESITGRSPVPITVLSDLAIGERLPPAAERTAYFVASEAIANAAKHSGATRCEVRLRRASVGRLAVEIEDDGGGGARIEPGGGLAGLADRVAGIDGTFTVSSPAGGPTVVRAEIPIGSAATA